MGRQDVLRRLGDRLVLPALPEVVQRIQALADDPQVPLREVGAVVAEDVGLTAKVLRIANSAYYGLQEPVISTEQAAAVIGMRSLKNIALQTSVVQQFQHLASRWGSDWEEFWAHSIFTARLCLLLSRKLGVALEITPEESYTCGLLHDLGKVVLLDGLGEEFLSVLARAGESGSALHQVEEEVLGFTHIDVGSLVAARWKLPEPVRHAIEFHHGPKSEILGDPATAIVALCDQIAYRLDTHGFEATVPQLASLAEQTLRMTPETFEEFLQAAREARAYVEV
jgi:putative nucleotidyltransferase with HDIG domain